MSEFSTVFLEILPMTDEGAEGKKRSILTVILNLRFFFRYAHIEINEDSITSLKVYFFKQAVVMRKIKTL